MSLETQEDPLVSQRRRCSLFRCFPHSRRSSSSSNPWWTRGIELLKKIREWSELVAGPKWKTFIRRFNKKNNRHCTGGNFQYDPLSYALNFDEGKHGDDFEGSEEFRDFSSRYAAVSGSGKKFTVSEAD